MSVIPEGYFPVILPIHTNSLLWQSPGLSQIAVGSEVRSIHHWP